MSLLTLMPLGPWHAPQASAISLPAAMSAASADATPAITTRALAAPKANLMGLSLPERTPR